MTKTFITLCVTVLIFVSGCFPTKTATSVTPRVPAKFDFSPPSRSTPGATAMTIALIQPIYITPHPEYYVSPFPEMSSSMGNDFEELLTAKGFKIRGPFRTRDEMVYNDKQSCDFAFEVQIDLNPTYNRHSRYDAGFGTIIPASYRMSGEITLGGNLVITATSSQYGEKIWKKNIPLDQSTFTYTGTQKWNAVPSVADELKEDNQLYNMLARELEKFYIKSMNLAWQQIDPAEMKTVAEQAKKADKRG
jgi:hypothetical protein